MCRGLGEVVFHRLGVELHHQELTSITGEDCLAPDPFNFHLRDCSADAEPRWCPKLG